MHSIKKVEEAARIAREAKRQKKMHEVDGARKKIFACYKNIDGHEKDFLEGSEVLLKSIPDLYTFWVMRRDVIMRMNPDDKLYKSETALTEAALFSNPKSYSAWNHRKWLMTKFSEPPLDREIAICEKALSIDCRNFHVWDYRRFIVQLLGRSMEQELEFAQMMVKKNPSNYSAWHYRINLLLESGGVISDEMFIKEMKNITEVCVVNSEDQTAWTYVNWLIDRFFNQNCIRKGFENVVSFTDNEIFDDKYHSTLVLLNAVTVDEIKELIDVDLEKQEYIARGKPDSTNYSSIPSRVWDIYSDAPVNPLFSSQNTENNFSFLEEPKRRYVNKTLLNQVYSSKPKVMSPEVQECLKTFNEVCRELMKDNNEANPWEICAAAHILPLISGMSDEIKDEVIQLYNKVKECDPQRKAMYDSMADEVILINYLNQKLPENDKTVLEMLLEKEGNLCLSFTDFACLYPLAGLIWIHHPSKDSLPFHIPTRCVFAYSLRCDIK